MGGGRRGGQQHGGGWWGAVRKWGAVCSPPQPPPVTTTFCALQGEDVPLTEQTVSQVGPPHGAPPPPQHLWGVPECPHLPLPPPHVPVPCLCPWVPPQCHLGAPEVPPPPTSPKPSPCPPFSSDTPRPPPPTSPRPSCTHGCPHPDVAPPPHSHRCCSRQRSRSSGRYCANAAPPGPPLHPKKHTVPPHFCVLLRLYLCHSPPPR